MSALQELINENKLYFEKCLKIRDKSANIVPFVTNDAQNRFLKIIEDHEAKYPDEATRPTLYIIILKARQLGFSTATEGIFFKKLNFGFNKVAMIVSYDEDSAVTINDMSDRFFKYLPQFLKPQRRSSRGKGILYENPKFNPNLEIGKDNDPGLQNKFLIETAKNLNAGSSYTINYLHISELAKWDKPEETMTSLMQAVPDHGGIVIVESTAMGMGGYFYELWQKAKSGENNFFPLFVAWFENLAYRATYTGFELTEYEKDIKATYHLDNDQLQWRRNTIKDKLNSDDDLFKQEYPSNDVEAFLTSGRPRFDAQVLMQYLNQCQNGKRGYLAHESGKVKFIADPKGYLEVWREPQKNKEYFIGVDVAKGLVTGDYSTAPVYDAGYNMQALWHGHIDPDLFAEQLELLGTWYNEALIAIEENNHGLTVINKLKQTYYNLYKRTQHDKIADKTTEQIGWYTTEQSKKLAIDNLAKLIRERNIGTKGRKFIEECLTYVIDDDGKTNAQNGSHDDIVMASAIILFVMDSYVTSTSEIVVGQTPLHGIGDNWQRLSDGRVVHKSEIEDKQDDIDGWAKGWFG